MSATEPLIEQIAAALEAVLRGITVAAGWQIEVGDVIRPDRRGHFRGPQHWECVMLQEDPRAAEAQSSGVEQWETDFVIDLCIRPSDYETTAFDTLANRAAAQLRKAIMAATTLTAALGVLDYAVGPWSKLVEIEGAYGGITLTVTVQHWHAEGDPYTVPGE